MFNIAVLIACHNRKHKTLSCIEVLMNQSNLGKNFTLEIYLVDDGSTDGTSNAVINQFPEVIIIKGDGNLFWNRGMHLAWSVASKKDFDFYLWLNDDTNLFQDALTILLKSMEDIDRLSIITGTTRSKYSEIPTYGGKLIQGGIITPKGYIEECELMNGNCVLVSRDVFLKLGNLDPIFTHGIGDYDYGLRAKKAGINLFIPGFYIGYCEKHESDPVYFSPSYPLKKRMEAIKSGLSIHPNQFFIYEKRHFGLLQAVFHYITIHLRLFFPSIWTFRSKNFIKNG
jgi:GT2 family glycosyltransferase